MPVLGVIGAPVATPVLASGARSLRSLPLTVLGIATGAPPYAKSCRPQDMPGPAIRQAKPGAHAPPRPSAARPRREDYGWGWAGR